MPEYGIKKVEVENFGMASKITLRSDAASIVLWRRTAPNTWDDLLMLDSGSMRFSGDDGKRWYARLDGDAACPDLVFVEIDANGEFSLDRHRIDRGFACLKVIEKIPLEGDLLHSPQPDTERTAS